MAAQIIFHRLASKEFLEARRWYARRSLKVTLRFVHFVDVGVRRIAESPEQWPIWRGSYRWIRVDRFPYVLFYRILPDGNVLIMAVAHSKRRPGYWQRRKLGG